MTQDKNEKYRIGPVVFANTKLLEWSSDSIQRLQSAPTTSRANILGDSFVIKVPAEVYEGHWRHDVVSTRIK